MRLRLLRRIFQLTGLNLADPILYDLLVRRFQSTQERDEVAKKLHTSSILEASLLRAETRITSVQTDVRTEYNTQNEFASLMEVEGEPDVTEPKTKDEAWAIWVRVMSRRFIEGRDEQFDYNQVDEDADLDYGLDEQRVADDTYFDAEDAAWEVSNDEIQGQTGVQDF
ncbi:MAG: hypothetical protein Q9162_002016 [Coniocarpon cinnabarinum]